MPSGFNNDGTPNKGSFKKGEHLNINHPNWKGGKPKCIDCGKQLSNYGYKQCRKCSYKNISGENSHLWRGGLTNTIWKDKNFLNKYYQVTHHKRRMRFKIGGELTVQTIQQVYEENIKKYGTLTCYLCLKPIEFRRDSLEHKIPLSKGGTNTKNNLDIAHRSCNAKKYNKTEKEYRKELLNC